MPLAKPTKSPKSIKHLLHHPSVANLMASLPTVKQLFFSIIGVVTLGFLLVSLLSYTPTDPAWSHVNSSDAVTNIAGRGGAWVADIFHLFFGFGSWWLTLVISYELLHLWVKPSAVVWQLRGVAYGFMLAIISALLAWWGASDEQALKLGGLVGLELHRGLAATIGGALALAFLVGLGLFIATLTFNIRWLSLTASLFNRERGEPAAHIDDGDAPSVETAGDTKMFDVVQIHHPKQYTPHNHVGTLQSFLQESGLRETLIGEQQKPAEPSHYGYLSDVHRPAPTTPSSDLVADDVAPADAVKPSQHASTQTPSQAVQHSATHASPQADILSDAPSFVPHHAPIDSPDALNDEHTVAADIFSDAFMQSLYEYQAEPDDEPHQAPAAHTHHDDAPSQPHANTIAPAPKVAPMVQHDVSPTPTAFDGVHIDEMAHATTVDAFGRPVMSKNPRGTTARFDKAAKTDDISTATTDAKGVAGLDDLENLENIEGLDALFGHLDNEKGKAPTPSQPSNQTNGTPQAPAVQPKPAQPTAQLSSAQPKSRAMGVLEHRLSLTPVPELTLLDPPAPKQTLYTPTQLQQLSDLLEIKLQEYNISAKVVSALVGPVVTRFEVELAAGVKVNRVVRITEDLARTMIVPSLRVLPIIAGKPYIGIEIPNRQRQVVSLIELLDTTDYRNPELGISLAVGVDISGKPVIADLAKAPHMLVAGTTGSGKSVLVNSLLLSMLLKYTPDELKLVLIDPKQLELANYADIPHLLTPVITDMTEATAALTWCVSEMERRYKLMSLLRVRNIASFNQAIAQAEAQGEPLLDPLWRPNDSVSVTSPPRLKPLANIVVVADEFADMIMQLGKTAEDPIVRLAQKSRAAGIHLILATQRPTANVVTGLIKSNIPSRVALKVGSPTDSRIIIEESGAENMLGHGDMMFLAPGKSYTERLHGAFVKDEEVNRVADAWRERGSPDYIDLSNSYTFEGEGSGDMASGGNSDDEYYDQAVAFVLDTRKVSISSIQRKLSIGYNRAARIVDMMEEQGLVSPMDNNGKRQLLA